MIIVVATAISLFFTRGFVRMAARYGWGKSVRRDGPSSHLSKEGTPTMGGIAFFAAALFAFFMLVPKTPDNWALVCLMVAAALLGWWDDVLSLKRKARQAAGEDASTGLLARYRLLGQALIAVAFAVYAAQTHQLFDIYALDVLIYSFAIIGSINAVNFSDGLDGLAAGLMVIMLIPFIAFGFSQAIIGALLGFLWFNSKPAKVFMGGVGSEGLGAVLAGIAIVNGWLWYLPLLALVPVLEVLSVMLQVSYFRLTGGKRILKMSPLHHHFELSGWSETQVVMRFWLVTALCVALAWWLRGAPL